MTLNPTDLSLALSPLVDFLERHHVKYYLGGSVASSVHGASRSTLDVDLAADLSDEHVQPLVETLQGEFYIDAGMISSALRNKSCFNIIHLPTMVKLDVFAVKDRPFDRSMLARTRPGFLDEDAENARPFLVASCEDIILVKLEWYRLGDEVSEKQWQDVRGVMKVQGHSLDQDYLTKWAGKLGVTDLLERVRSEFTGK